MRKHIWIGYVFAVICLYYAFRGISFQELGTSLARADGRWILLALMLYFVDFFIRSQRWSILITPVKPISARELFWPMMIGFLANNILPLRMGEIVRAHVCGKKFNISRSASLGSIFLERIGDTLAFLFTFLVASHFYSFPKYMEKGAWVLGGGCIFAVVGLLFIRRHEKLFFSLLGQSPFPLSWQSKIHHLATHFIQSTSGVTQMRYVVEVMGLSLIVWILEGTFLFLIGRAFALPMDFGQSFFLLFALGLSVTLPQGPGYVGTFEFFGVTALTLLGISKHQGLPVILAVHGMQFLTVTLVGMIGLWREGLSFRSLSSSL